MKRVYKTEEVCTNRGVILSISDLLISSLFLDGKYYWGSAALVERCSLLGISFGISERITLKTGIDGIVYFKNYIIKIGLLTSIDPLYRIFFLGNLLVLEWNRVGETIVLSDKKFVLNWSGIHSEQIISVHSIISLYGFIGNHDIVFFKKVPTFNERDYIHSPLHTGNVLLDCMYPFGKGQRVAIIGDFGAGKTTFAISVIELQCLSFKENNRWCSIYFEKELFPFYFKYCIYVGIGRRSVDLVRIKEYLMSKGINKELIILHERWGVSPFLMSLVPDISMCLCYWYQSLGYDVVLILDEWYEHSVSYREISLLMKKSPGREGFPGDLFAVHAKMLERCFVCTMKDGGASITCFVLVESKLHDYTGYLPTSIISICDGQLVIDSRISFRIVLVKSLSRWGSAVRDNLGKGLFFLIKEVFFFFQQNIMNSNINSDELVDSKEKWLFVRSLKMLSCLEVTITNSFKYVTIWIRLFSIADQVWDFLTNVSFVSFLNIYEKEKKNLNLRLPFIVSFIYRPINGISTSLGWIFLSCLKDYLYYYLKEFYVNIKLKI